MDLYIIILILSICGIFLSAFFSAKNSGKNNKEKVNNFRQKLSDTIIYSQPSWPELLQVARSSEVTIETVYVNLLDLNASILSGEAKGTELEKHKDIIRDYIITYEEQDQYKALPPEIQLNFNKLGEVLANEHKHLLSPLSDEVKRLLSDYKKNNLKQRRIASWSLIITFISAIFGIYAYFFPMQEKLADETASINQHISTEKSNTDSNVASK